MGAGAATRHIQLLGDQGVLQQAAETLGIPSPCGSAVVVTSLFPLPSAPLPRDCFGYCLGAGWGMGVGMGRCLVRRDGGDANGCCLSVHSRGEDPEAQAALCALCPEESHRLHFVVRHADHHPH